MKTVYSIKPYTASAQVYPATQAAVKGTRLLSLGLKPQGFTARFDKNPAFPKINFISTFP
jgi:hypothetical protein